MSDTEERFSNKKFIFTQIKRSNQFGHVVLMLLYLGYSKRSIMSMFNISRPTLLKLIQVSAKDADIFLKAVKELDL